MKRIDNILGDYLELVADPAIYVWKFDLAFFKSIGTTFKINGPYRRSRYFEQPIHVYITVEISCPF